MRWTRREKHTDGKSERFLVCEGFAAPLLAVGVRAACGEQRAASRSSGWPTLTVSKETGIPGIGSQGMDTLDDLTEHGSWLYPGRQTRAHTVSS